MHDSIHHFDPLNKLFSLFRHSFTLQEQIFDSKSSIRNYFFWRLFDPKNAYNMFDNLETKGYLAPKMYSNGQLCVNLMKYWIYDQ